MGVFAKQSVFINLGADYKEAGEKKLH